MDYLCDCKKTVSIKAVIKNTAGEICVTKDSHGFYDLPGGRMRCGEDITETLVREIREELGATVIKVDERPALTFLWQNKERQAHGLIIAFFVEVDNIKKGEDSEIINIEWATPEKVFELNMPPDWKKGYSSLA